VNDENIIVCRCEDVTLKEIKDAIADGYTSIDEVKRITRCGMGPCQGKTCTPVIAREIAKVTGQKLEDIEYPKYRPPFSGILFKEVIGDANEK